MVGVVGLRATAHLTLANGNRAFLDFAPLDN